MKSQRRHELQHNALDAELAKSVNFFRKHLSQIAWVLVIGALIVMVLVYNKSQRQQRASQMQSEFNQLISLPLSNDEELVIATAGLKNLAAQDKDRAIAAGANVYLGSIYARLGVTGQSSILILAGESPAQMAEQYYTAAISNFPDQPQAVSKAQLGLARIAEDRGEIDAARAKYQAVLDTPGAEGFPVAQAASDALERIDSSSSPVRFATTAPAEPDQAPPAQDAATEPAEQPAEEPSDVDGQ